MGSVWKTICGFFCPFGLIQELIYKIPFQKKNYGNGLPVKYVLLAVFVVIMPVTMVNELGMSARRFANTFARQERWKE